MRKVLAMLAMSMIVGVTPALAITDGELDGDGHPQVGIMAAYDRDGAYLWRCSGTALSRRHVLTAGHCVEPPAVSARVWFEADMEGDADWPDDGGYEGDIFLHPRYDPVLFWLYDVGMVVLDDGYDTAEYGKLPALDKLDDLVFKKAGSRGKRKLTFTSVGYGLQRAFYNPASWKDVAEKTRMVAYPKLIQIDVKGSTGDQSLILSNNTRTGGTCFGDSGGPNFIGDSLVIGGVTSFGINGNCAGTGGVFRVDRSWSLDWIETFLP